MNTTQQQPLAFIVYFSVADEYQVRQIAEDLRKRGIQALAWPHTLDRKWRKLRKEVSRRGTTKLALLFAFGQPAPASRTRDIVRDINRLFETLSRRPVHIFSLALAKTTALPNDIQARPIDLSGPNYTANISEIARLLGAAPTLEPREAPTEAPVVSGIFEVSRSQSAMFAQLKEEIAQGRIDQKYLYWDVRAALRWQQIAELSTYLTAQSSMNLLVAHADEMFQHIVAESSHQCFSFINFGVGTGVKDYLILEQLLRNPEASILYFPVDESLSMIQVTIQAMQELIVAYGKRLSIQFILDDFANAERFSQHILEQERLHFRGAPVTHILGFLGASLGNFNESDVLSQIRRLMVNDDDRLILGVEFVANRSAQDLISNYSDLKMRRFLFGPIQDVEGLTPNWDRDFHYEVMEGRSKVAGARTVVGQVYYRDQFVELFSASKYERASLESFLGGQGLRVVASYLSDDDPPRFGKYVLAAV